MDNLTFEAFEGIGKLKSMNFYEYILVGKGEMKNKYSIINKARYSMHSRNSFNAVFVKDDKLYTLKEFNVIPDLEEVDIKLNRSVILDIENNTKVYEKVVEYYINSNLRKIKILGKYKKYQTKNTDEIISNTILSRNLTEEFKSSENGYKLKRKFKITPVVEKNGSVILYISCSSDFSFDKSIYQMINEGMDVVGLRVINKWNNINGNLVIQRISNKKINEPILFGQSLIDYYKNRNQRKRVENFTEEDMNANVIIVKANKEELKCIPHALEPVITREYLSKNDPKFSNDIETLIKMDMNYRYNILKSFISDIGSIKELDNLSFKKEYYDDIGLLGYNIGKLDDPILMGAKGTIKNKINVFSNGFYKMPPNQVKFGVIFPEGHEEASKKTMRAIYDFATRGKYHNQENKYIKDHLMNICFKPKECIFESYKFGDIINYKKIAMKLKNYHNIEFVVAIIPNIDENDIENPYNPFKSIWAELNLPSQMISLKTANIFKNSIDQTALYYLHNISLGILGKIGGIPWIIKDMQGDVDCFIGLDVGTREKGIHYPACSVVFDKFGKLINYYKPNIPQSGEIIEINILQEIFDKILLSYEEENGEYPKNIVIHRDGFSREDLSWYKEYFSEKEIKFNIIEVRKNTPIKIAKLDNKKVSNPPIGSFIKKGNKAFLVTTDIRENLGSPRPLKIEKTYGDIDMITILNQIYALTKIHVGSPKSLRLPITTGYADKICKAIEFIPRGVLDNRLFFL